MLISIDHGNKQIKGTRCPPFVSGLQQSTTRPFGRDVLEYQGIYYTLSARRMPYQKDKTLDERYFILTLFAIAGEIEAADAYRDGVIPVELAVGLPPAQYGAQYKAFVRYFQRENVTAFTYHNKLYRIHLHSVACFPQAYAAAATRLSELVPVPKALILDIGGFTADYLLLKHGRADLSTCGSLENGVIHLYNRICSRANAEFDLLLDESDVDALLRGETAGFPPAIAQLAEQQAQGFIQDLFGTLREYQLDLRTGTVLFMGGGSILLRDQIEASGRVGKALFIEDINANAKGYEYLAKLMQAGGEGA
ncbi:MAG TPA: ParM/StbA family protein [Candidatus Gemmiger avium]|nr:ParM/StbA family protein [Candidatus Gemmiger avium]